MGRQAHLGGDLRARIGYNEILVVAGESDSPGPPPTEVELVVGTHALIQEEVAFANLGLAVVDEQHRFGVRQRVLLK